MRIYALALGSNLGNKEENIQSALNQLEKSCGQILQRSSLFLTEPLYASTSAAPQPDYINACLTLQSTLLPEQLLQKTLCIEANLGRVRTEGTKWEARVIDLDLILCDQLVIKEKDLVIPHPEMHKRLFVLDPLNQIAPGWVHPILKKTVRQLLTDLINISKVV